MPIQFKLRSTTLGPGELLVIAFHDGIALGTMRLTPTVVEQLESNMDSPASHEQPLAPISVRHPDLILFIEDTKIDGRRAFTLRITALNQSLNLHNTKFGPVLFQSDPGPYFQEFYKDIEEYRVQTEVDRMITARNLESKGVFLFNKLFPRELQHTLWILKDQIKSVLVESEEPWIPWELCKLCEQEDGQTVEGPFFCEAFAMARWIPGFGLRSRLTLENIAVVVPGDSGLPLASTERDYLLSLAGSSRKATCIPARFLDLYKAMKSGQYDCWHFTGHGGYRGTNPNRSVMYLEKKERFTPEHLVGEVTRLGKTHPFVFLNACQLGQSDMSLTDIGGWASQFLAAGAGAFVGAYWSVYDRDACDFTRELYSRLLAGIPVGRAVQEARIAIKASGNPTWLAYTVFADPFAVQTDPYDA